MSTLCLISMLKGHLGVDPPYGLLRGQWGGDTRASHLALFSSVVFTLPKFNSYVKLALTDILNMSKGVSNV